MTKREFGFLITVSICFVGCCYIARTRKKKKISAKKPTRKLSPENFKEIDFAEEDFRVRYKFLCGSILPRPILCISTVSSDGIYNIAPLSFGAPCTSEPPTIMFSVTTKKGGNQPNQPSNQPGIWKDTLVNILNTKQFVINHVEKNIFNKVYQTSAELDPEVDEFKAVGLTPIESVKVKPPRILESPIQMECELIKAIPLNQNNYGGSTVIIGKILHGHVHKDYYDEQKIINNRELKSVSRLDGLNYGSSKPCFSVNNGVWDMSNW